MTNGFEPPHSENFFHLLLSLERGSGTAGSRGSRTEGERTSGESAERGTGKTGKEEGFYSSVSYNCYFASLSVYLLFCLWSVYVMQSISNHNI